MNQTRDTFYWTNGTLHGDAPSYVDRQADRDLYDGLMAGEFCYVLTSRQMGKSSLMVRTAQRLRQEGVRVAVLDLTGIGQEVTPEQWYGGLLDNLGEQLKVAEELEQFWLEHEGLGPLQRWMKALREVVLANRQGQVVVFVDEIDAVRNLKFSTDEFFAGIRACYNRRTEDAELGRLTFCLVGVATPADLIQDTRTTPFNIGRRIELHDFTESEAAPLAQGLGREEGQAALLVRRILFWTGGHPYLTQLLCRAVANDPGVTGPAGVDRVCRDMFLSSRARGEDNNLKFVRDRLLRSEVDQAGLLDLYARVRRRRPVSDNETCPLVSILRLSGITRVVAGRLVVRNRIYDHVFDRAWVRANMPDAELRRQRTAFRRGLVRGGAVAGVVIALVSALAVIAWKQARRADANAALIIDQARRAQPPLDFLVGQYVVPDDREARNRGVTPREIMDQRAKLIKNLQVHPIFQGSLLRALGNAYLKEGLHEQAEEYLRPAFEIQSKVLKDKDPEYADIFSSLAVFNQVKGDYDKALEFYEKAREIRQQVRGKLHSDYAKNLHNLASVYQAKKWYAQAENHYRQALNVYERLGREQRLPYAQTLDNLAQLYQVMKRYGEAQQVYRQVLDICTRTLGKKHPKAIIARLSLEVIHAQLGDYRQATAGADRVAQEKPAKSDILYELARVYAASYGAVLRDLKLSRAEQKKEADRAITQALGFLARVRAEGFFTNPVQIEGLRKDPAFDPLRSQDEFKDFLGGLGKQPEPGQPSGRPEGTSC